MKTGVFGEERHSITFISYGALNITGKELQCCAHEERNESNLILAGGEKRHVTPKRVTWPNESNSMNPIQ